MSEFVFRELDASRSNGEKVQELIRNRIGAMAVYAGDPIPAATLDQIANPSDDDMVEAQVERLRKASDDAEDARYAGAFQGDELVGFARGWDLTVGRYVPFARLGFGTTLKIASRLGVQHLPFWRPYGINDFTTEFDLDSDDYQECATGLMREQINYARRDLHKREVRLIVGPDETALAGIAKQRFNMMYLRSAQLPMGNPKIGVEIKHDMYMTR